MKYKNQGLALAVIVMATISNAQLYGVGNVNETNTFYQIDTTTGAATALFSYSGGTFANDLAYNPVTNKFVTVQSESSFSKRIVEIDPVALTATIKANQVPSPQFEGVEYSSILGGLVVSYGPNTGAATTSLALLDDNYNLIANRPTTGILDMDCLFTDQLGALNKLDVNNPTAGFQRSRLSNVFTGTFTSTGVGNNIFSTGISAGMTYNVSDNRLYLSQLTSLARVNFANTTVTNVGNFGLDGSGNPISITGIAAVPEPVSMVAVIGAIALLAKKRKN